jgi:FKBP-type peptidyl-prolyl cis-trans isomerase
MIYATLSILALLAGAVQGAGLTVTQTGGPTECEEKTAVGQHLSMHYTGTIDESSATGVKGSQFDSSIPRGKTFDFPLGGGRVIRGWDEGLVGLCKGAKATLIIPPEMGYGDSGERERERAPVIVREGRGWSDEQLSFVMMSHEQLS